jgi:hypothetical protein
VIDLSNCQRTLAICAFTLFGLLQLNPTNAATKIGNVAAVMGAPAASGAGGTRVLKTGSEVFEGDVIKVTSGNAQIILADGTKLVVGPDSRLELNQYLKRGEHVDKISIKALRGTFRFITGNSDKKAYDIRTTNSTIGIRGTGFDFWVKKKTGVIVMLGAVRLRGNNGKVVDMTDNCDLGVAGDNAVKAELLDGKKKSDTIGANLVFVADQRALLKSFYLPIRKCRPFILFNDIGKGKSSPPAARQGG